MNLEHIENEQGFIVISEFACDIYHRIIQGEMIKS